MGSGLSPSTTSCPGCGHVLPLEELLSRFESERTLTRLGGSRGGDEPSGPTLTQQCRRCFASVKVTFRRAASQIIDRKTDDLFASIAQVLGGKVDTN